MVHGITLQKNGEVCQLLVAAQNVGQVGRTLVAPRSAWVSAKIDSTPMKYYWNAIENRLVTLFALDIFGYLWISLDIFGYLWILGIFGYYSTSMSHCPCYLLVNTLLKSFNLGLQVWMSWPLKSSASKVFLVPCDLCFSGCRQPIWTLAYCFCIFLLCF